MTEPGPEPDLEPDPDEALAKLLHEWLDSRPRHYLQLRDAVERWLIAKHL